jgi:hypothetical protein
MGRLSHVKSVGWRGSIQYLARFGGHGLGSLQTYFNRTNAVFPILFYLQREMLLIAIKEFIPSGNFRLGAYGPLQVALRCKLK